MTTLLKIEGDKTIVERNKDDIGIIRAEQGVILERDRVTGSGVRVTGAVDISKDSRMADIAVGEAESKLSEIRTKNMLSQIELEKKIREQAVVQNKGLELQAKIKIDEAEILELESESKKIQVETSCYCCVSLSKDEHMKVFKNTKEIEKLKKRVKDYKNELIMWTSTVGSADIKFSNGGALLDYSRVQDVTAAQVEGITRKLI